ncbi:MAG: hypothetical protein WC151_07940 [Bacteroidales bacterium]|nr:hypothetical protein [Bacteroidales bacterium]
MKRNHRIVLIPILCLCFSVYLQAQPDPSKNGDGSQVGGEPIGHSAPVGNGTLIMLGMITTYIIGKTLKAKKEKDKRTH